MTADSTRQLLVGAMALVVGTLWATGSSAQQAAARPNATPPSSNAAPVEVIPVRGNIYLVGGAGSNITISAGPDGVFAVDTGLADHADKALAAIAELQKQLQLTQPPTSRSGAETRAATNLEPYYRSAPPKPIRYIANTSVLTDHIGGNERFALAGKTFTGGNVAGELSDVAEGAAILAHENVLTRMSEAKLPGRMLPTESYFGNVMKLSYFFNGEGIELLHVANATAVRAPKQSA